MTVPEHDLQQLPIWISVAIAAVVTWIAVL
jgi:hypothetical protein